MPGRSSRAAQLPVRGWRLLANLILLALLGLLVGPAQAGNKPLAGRSGLPWTSGVYTSSSTTRSLEVWRGRPLDVETTFFGNTSWSHMISSAGGLRSKLPTVPGRLIVALGLLPHDQAGKLAECAAGQFDGFIQSIRTSMLNNGALAAATAGRPVMLRLGWEANSVEDGFPWRATGDGTSWAACFRRWVDILNPVTDASSTPPARQKSFTIVWNMANRGSLSFPIDNMWPGDDYVDIVGSQFYDRCPPLPPSNNDAEWARRLTARDAYGNPAGPLAWLSYAKSKGKPYAIPEWGVAGPTFVCNTPGIDNPYFIRKMYQFFWWNADDIAFESYFNGHGANDDSRGSHKLFAPDPSFPSPSAANYQSYVGRYAPQSSLTYRQLWSAGVQPPDEPSEPPPPTVPGPQDTLYWLRYVASYPDLIAANATAADAYNDWLNNGSDPNRVAWFEPDDYMARYPAFASQFNNDPIAATQHFIRTGYAKGYNWSQWKLYWLRYIASYQDLINQYGTLITGGEAHWYAFGKPQGRSIMFRPVAYLNSNPDAKAACGTDQVCGTTYYITHNQTPSP